MLAQKEKCFNTHVAISLEQIVPLSNFYRQLEAELDLGFVHDLVKSHDAITIFDFRWRRQPKYFRIDRTCGVVSEHKKYAGCVSRSNERLSATAGAAPHEQESLLSL